MTDTSLFTVSFVLYVAALVVYFAALFARKDGWARGGLFLALAGLAFHTAALVLRAASSGHAPFTNMFESLSFLSWAIVVALGVFGRKSNGPKIGPYLMLIVVALVALASSPLMPKQAAPLVPALQSYWLWLHVSVTLLGEAFFAVAFVASLLFLAADNEDKRARLDALAYRAVAVGFPLFTLGGLVFGMVWAYRAWGRYWAWDPKEVWSLITWFVFALYLHTRIVMGWKGKRSAWIAVAGFLAALFTYFGVNYLLAGLHSYA
jgi:ABC-type transport system involved in cytochrome c biogenesis permease subunit